MCVSCKARNWHHAGLNKDKYEYNKETVNYLTTFNNHFYSFHSKLNFGTYLKRYFKDWSLVPSPTETKVLVSMPVGTQRWNDVISTLIKRRGTQHLNTIVSTLIKGPGHWINVETT